MIMISYIIHIILILNFYLALQSNESFPISLLTFDYLICLVFNFQYLTSLLGLSLQSQYFQISLEHLNLLCLINISIMFIYHFPNFFFSPEKNTNNYNRFCILYWMYACDLSRPLASDRSKNFCCWFFWNRHLEPNLKL